MGRDTLPTATGGAQLLQLSCIMLFSESRRPHDERKEALLSALLVTRREAHKDRIISHSSDWSERINVCVVFGKRVGGRRFWEGASRVSVLGLGGADLGCGGSGHEFRDYVLYFGGKGLLVMLEKAVDFGVRICVILLLGHQLVTRRVRYDRKATFHCIPARIPSYLVIYILGFGARKYTLCSLTCMEQGTKIR